MDNNSTRHMATGMTAVGAAAGTTAVVEAATATRQRWNGTALAFRDANGSRYPAPFRTRRRRAGTSVG